MVAARTTFVLACLGACLRLTSAVAQRQAAPASFEVASVKSVKTPIGGDGFVTTNPGGLFATNVTLRRLLFEAWQIPYWQISGGPAWIGTQEFDIDAKPGSPANPAALRTMLRTLLIERFKLKVHTETRERRVYAMVAGKDSARLLSAVPREGAWVHRFHGSLTEFANVLAIQLTIPLTASGNPGIPSIASGAPIPVVNKTAIEGVFDIGVDVRPDDSGDTVTVWQRALKEQFGLELKSQRAAVEILVVDHAEKVAGGN
jgi:uncharacterized protein (TIGR03435 family)